MVRCQGAGPLLPDPSVEEFITLTLLRPGIGGADPIGANSLDIAPAARRANRDGKATKP